ncbi:MAG: hypothetical protein R3B95_19475 [Nitrospirales bacterium]|nr:hypothetical protein [Nitrospirales bacterium]
MKSGIWRRERREDPRELGRLAIPWRVYTQSHVNQVIDVVEEVFRCRERLKPRRFLEQTPFLRHFTLSLEWWNNHQNEHGGK